MTLSQVLWKSGFFILALNVSSAFAADQKEKLDIKNLQRAYWNKTNETEVEAVQNRLYSKRLKFELGPFAGTLSTDPFISDWSVGGLLGFHISEYFSLNALYWKDFTSNSSSYDTFVLANGVVPNTDIPKAFLGGELAFSPLYGKLSLLNLGIIYFDTHFMVGGGVRNSESGNTGAILVGVGEQVYLTQFLSLRIDYRLLRFTETKLEKSIQSNLGNPVGQNIRLDSSVTIGLTFLLGPL